MQTIIYNLNIYIYIPLKMMLEMTASLRKNTGSIAKLMPICPYKSKHVYCVNKVLTLNAKIARWTWGAKKHGKYLEIFRFSKRSFNRVIICDSRKKFLSALDLDLWTKLHYFRKPTHYQTFFSINATILEPWSVLSICLLKVW